MNPSHDSDDDDGDFRQLARQPKYRKVFEKMLRFSARKGDAEQVRERLGWGLDPNCASKKGRTPLIINVKGFSPNAAVVRVLLATGADPTLLDINGLSALDYARRKYMRYGHRKPPKRSPSLDENNNLVLPKWEQRQVDKMRKENAEYGAEIVRIYLQERVKVARRVFNDPAQIAQVLEILEETDRNLRG
jgi:hypothetical protein